MNLLINPTDMKHSGGFVTPNPLGLLYVASTDKDTVIYDAARDGPPDKYLRKSKPAVVGVTMYTLGRKESLRILALAKSLGARTVAGGPHIGLMLRQLQSNYDFVDHWVVGDGEWAWRDLCSGNAHDRAFSVPVQNLDDLPLPAWDRINVGTYKGRIGVIFSRGCTGHCDFCSTWWVQGRYRHHSPEWMSRQLQYLWDQGIRNIMFRDDCLTALREPAVQLFEMMTRFKFSWEATTRVDAIDTELARLMKRAGCAKLGFGIEHGSPRMLQLMRKHTTPEQAIKAREICKEVGIHFLALMIRGYPGETDEDRRINAEFSVKLNPDEWGSMGHTVVLPGTALYRRLKKAGHISDNFWLGDEPYYIHEGAI